jgi:hypothetical protein
MKQANNNKSAARAFIESDGRGEGGGKVN